MTSSPKNTLLIAQITSAHGLRGEVKIRSFFGNPEDILSHSEFYDENGKPFNIKIRKQMKGDIVIAFVEGVSDRNQAEKLVGIELYIDKENLPELAENEFYFADLIGAEARLANGDIFGKVIDTHDYGAGDIIEIQLHDSDKTEMFLYNKQNFPEVKLEEGCIIINPPEDAWHREER